MNIIRFFTDRPIAGTIHYVVAADRTRTTTNHSDTRSFDVDAQITFAADGPSELELDGKRRYDLDVTSGAVVRRSR